MSNKNIQSILHEERTFAPPAGFTARARIKPADLESLRRRAREDHVGFWAELAAPRTYLADALHGDAR